MVTAATPSRTVIILANDNVATWLTACLSSLRANSPQLVCKMIPFDEKTDKVKAIAEEYNVQFVQGKYLRDLTELGKAFCPEDRTAQHVFRKLAAFLVSNSSESVLFSDADIVFLRPVEELFEAFEKSDYQLLYADSDITRVYADDAFAQRMVCDYDAKGINTGFWMSRGNLFSLSDFYALAERAESDKQFFDAKTMEQPFLNYCLDVTRKRYEHFSVVVKDFPRCSWGALPAVRVGNTWFCSKTINDCSVPLYMLHWAGHGYGWNMTNKEIFLGALLRKSGRLGSAMIRSNWLRAHVVDLTVARLRRTALARPLRFLKRILSRHYT